MCRANTIQLERQSPTLRFHALHRGWYYRWRHSTRTAKCLPRSPGCTRLTSDKSRRQCTEVGPNRCCDYTSRRTQSLQCPSRGSSCQGAYGTQQKCCADKIEHACVCCHKCCAQQRTSYGGIVDDFVCTVVMASSRRPFLFTAVNNLQALCSCSAFLTFLYIHLMLLWQWLGGLRRLALARFAVNEQASADSRFGELDRDRHHDGRLDRHSISVA